jgi:hypothetical protein
MKKSISCHVIIVFYYIARPLEAIAAHFYQIRKCEEVVNFNVYSSKEATSMSNQPILYLHTLPVELVYRILDNLDLVTILLSFRNVCTRLNIISDTYYRYKVNIIHYNKRLSVMI